MIMIGRNHILNISLFLLFPIYSLLLSIINFKHNRISLYMIGAFFSLFGAFLPPTSDAYRYREEYYNSSSYSFEILEIGNKDCLFQILSNLFHSIGFSFECFKFVLLLICYYLWIWIFYDILSKKNISRDLYLFLALSAIFSIRLFTLAYGIRFGVASVFSIYSLYVFYKRKFALSFIFIFLSVLMHFSMLVMLGMMLGACVLMLFRINLRVKMIILLLLILLVSASLVMYVDVFAFFVGNDFISAYSKNYIDGHWGTESMLAWLSFNGLVFTIGRILPIVIIGIYCSKVNSNSFLANCFVISLLLLAISWSSLTLLLRFSNLAIMIGFIFLIQNIEFLNNPLKKSKLLFFSFLTVFLFYAYALRDDLKYGRQYYALLCPIYSFSTDFYPDAWVNRNLRNDGLFINTSMKTF